MSLNWVIGADHAAVQAKAALKDWLEKRGDTVLDMGGHDPAANDSTAEVADAVVPKVLAGQADLGILICGNGLGVSVRANRYPGIRAALLYSDFVAEHARAHTNANILCFGARTMSVDEMTARLEIFLNTPYEAGRHVPRNLLQDAPLVTIQRKESK